MSEDDLSSDAYRDYRAGLKRASRRSAGTVVRQLLFGTAVVLTIPVLLMLLGFVLKAFR
jgi:hypothetical protein